MQKLISLALTLSVSLRLCASSDPPLAAGVQRAVDAISASELKGDLSFLASDTLQGRYTPSPGLDAAAEFIASKFRAAGLEPAGDHDYFQTVEMVDRRLPGMVSNLTMTVGDDALTVTPAEMSIEAATAAAHFEKLPAVTFAAKDAALLKGVELKGKAVLALDANWTTLSADKRMAEYRKSREFETAASAAGAALILTVTDSKRPAQPSRLLFAEQAATAQPPSLRLHSERLAKTLAAPEQAAVTVSAEIPAPIDNRVTVKNVIGILRGADPALSQTAVLLSAHYDHVGTVETAGPLSMHAAGDSKDRVYNGANDDGSGTVSVIEIARALAKIEPRPRRSITFIAFFGEERGGLGSKFYGRHPAFPLDKTVADLNLEQMGRTDSTAGPQLNTASLTGFDYSDVTEFLIKAGNRAGIKVYRDAEASDAYFTRSDNDALAEQGVPAHTLCVAFDYADYHGVGDEWQKVDYENMARVDKMVLLALFDMANSAKAPEWNPKNPKTEPFRAVRAKELSPR